MKKSQSKKRSTRNTKQSTSVPSLSHEVTPDQVIAHLLDLFDHIGILLPNKSSVLAEWNATKSLTHPLYSHAHAIGELLSCWHQNPNYLDGLGNPVQIKFRGRAPSFCSLVKRNMAAMDPTFLLTELVRLGIVRKDDTGRIHVQTRSFLPYADRHLAAQHTLASLDGFILTLQHNLNSAPMNSDQLFHRIAWNTAFDSREIPALKIRMKRHGERFLESFDDWLSRKALKKLGKTIPRSRTAKVSVGVYLSVEKT